jgi:hypothetical protein
MTSSARKWFGSTRAIAIVCVVTFLLSVSVTSAIVRWKHRHELSTQGFDFSDRLNDESSGPRVGEIIDLTVPRREDGRTLSDLARNSRFLIVAVVDPECPACKATERQMSDIGERLSSYNIPYCLLMLNRRTSASEYLEYARSLGLDSTAFVWRNDKTSPPKALAEMVIPSHLLLDRNGWS